MATSPIEFIKHLTNRKTKWDNLTETERKDFAGFMVNRFLSMNFDYLDLVNDIQKLNLPKEQLYRLYLEVLPKNIPYSKYISKKSGGGYSEELIQFIIKEYEISSEDASQYLDILYTSESGLEALRALLSKYGISEKEIKKLINGK